MSEQNKMVERTLIEEIWNRGNFAMVDQLVSPGFRGHSSSPESDTLGAEGYREYYRALRTGSDLLSRWYCASTLRTRVPGYQPPVRAMARAVRPEVARRPR